MGKLKTLLLVLLCGGLIYFAFYLYNPTDLGIYDEQLYLLSEVLDDVNFTPYSENTGIIDLAGLSNIVINMQKAGYKIQNMKTTDETIDIILQSDFEVHRLYFTKEKEIISISSPYSKSGVPFTYINEKKNLE